MPKELFLSLLDAAIKQGKGIKVSVMGPKLIEPEVIINPAINVDAKRDYYAKAYDSKMRLDSFKKIRVVDLELID